MSKSKKKKLGRPPKYKTVEELNFVVDKWIEQFSTPNRILTKVNFILFANISRETYNAWKKKDHPFSDTIKMVDNLIEDAWVQRLAGNSVAGAIFYLKNAFKKSYRDRYDTDITSGGEKLQPVLVKFINSKDENDSNPE